MYIPNHACLSTNVFEDSNKFYSINYKVGTNQINILEVDDSQDYIKKPYSTIVLPGKCKIHHIKLTSNDKHLIVICQEQSGINKVFIYQVNSKGLKNNPTPIKIQNFTHLEDDGKVVYLFGVNDSVCLDYTVDGIKESAMDISWYRPNKKAA